MHLLKVIFLTLRSFSFVIVSGKSICDNSISLESSLFILILFEMCSFILGSGTLSRCFQCHTRINISFIALKTKCIFFIYSFTISVLVSFLCSRFYSTGSLYR